MAASEPVGRPTGAAVRRPARVPRVPGIAMADRRAVRVAVAGHRVLAIWKPVRAEIVRATADLGATVASGLGMMAGLDATAGRGVMAGSDVTAGRGVMA